jgi:hypothetical protein
LDKTQDCLVSKPQRFPGKNALVFVTYSGPHTGIDEAPPVGKDIRQYFEHRGFNVIDEWYILSEYHGSRAVPWAD